jgi:hypothetical protein
MGRCAIEAKEKKIFYIPIDVTDFLGKQHMKSYTRLGPDV